VVKRASLALVLLAACGGEERVRVQLSLERQYDAIGVVRWFPEGAVPTEFRDLALTFDALATSGGRASGTITQKGASESTAFSGTFDAVSGQLMAQPFTAALTSSIAESVQEFGGRADDALPFDGVAEEITGFIRTMRGQAITDGLFLATARTDRRPRAPEESLIAVELIDTTRVRISGAPGAVVASAGVEAFRFELRKRDPEFDLAQSREDGSFSLEMPALREDVFLVRSRVIGAASDARFFRVR
jgi:hypothetical protein